MSDSAAHSVVAVPVNLVGRILRGVAEVATTVATIATDLVKIVADPFTTSSGS
jgi:hypothetical protein